jgi:hypothetical protein
MQPLHSETVMRHKKTHPFYSFQYGESIAASIIRWGVQEVCGWGQQGVTSSCSSKIQGGIFFSMQLCNPCIVRLWWGINNHTHSLPPNMEDPFQHQSFNEATKNFVAGVSKEWLVVAVAKFRVTDFSPRNLQPLHSETVMRHQKKHPFTSFQYGIHCSINH